MSRRHNGSQQRQVFNLRPHVFIGSQMLQCGRDPSSVVKWEFSFHACSKCALEEPVWAANLSARMSPNLCGFHMGIHVEYWPLFQWLLMKSSSYPEMQAFMSRLELVSFYLNLHIKQLTWAGISLLMALWMTSWNSYLENLRHKGWVHICRVSYLSVDDHRATFSSEEHWIYFGLNLRKMLWGDFVLSLMIVLLIWIK